MRQVLGGHPLHFGWRPAVSLHARNVRPLTSVAAAITAQYVVYKLRPH